ncbi:ABC transporter substrate-binding protein [Allokutzneria albata]|uniref:Iron complex transport system substrate-binding protein n=1 Tax=Allokutzneria albata TaxID=211114 RepID=A0A1H0ALK4_ALLAB|nr:iron-siderophore ABC transporter substrate-binding protein [Allokutzneria albata]SDN34410.1 iron complex transport system substrate-binding protein [Allokutzneria albata]
MGRRVFAGVAALTVAAVVAGCGGGTAPGSQPPASGQAGAGFPRTVKHAMGETTIAAAPKKVAALDSSYVDAAFALETEVVAFTLFPLTGDKFPDYLKAEAEVYGRNAKAVGTLEQPKVEETLALNPDLIVSAKVRHEQLYGQLSARKPAVFSQTTGLTWKDNIRLLGTALGKEELADRKIKAYEERARKVGDAIRAKAGKNPTISVVRFVNGPTRLYTPNSFVGIVLKDAGLARPASQDDSKAKDISVNVAEERILDADADHVFVSVFPDAKGDSAKAKEKYLANPLWKQLKGKVTDVQDGTWIASVSLQGAHAILDDLAKAFGVDPARS